MPNIMIVEDEINTALGLESIIKSIDENMDVTITGYAKKALEEAKKRTYDLFLLDIELLDYTGMELAKELRKMDKYKLTFIVFITAVPTKELLAFKEIHCYDYIVKPFGEKEVTHTLKTLIQFGIEKEEFINFTLKNLIYRIKFDDIIYLEVVRRKIKVVTVNEEFEVSQYTLSSLEEDLSEDFVRCHKGFIVNIKYISSIDKTNSLINLKSTNDIIPIGRKYKDNLEVLLSESI